VERSVTATRLRLELAGPRGVCSTPPTIGTIRNWVKLGMPYVTVPGKVRRQYLVSKCMKWVERNRKMEK
jgi:hypothetical protein